MTDLSHVLPKELDLLTFTAPAPVLEAVKVTEDNLVALAKWMHADSYTVTHDFERDVKLVNFETSREGGGSLQTHKYTLVRTMIGGYITMFPEGVNTTGSRFSERLYGVEQSDIDRFIRQTMDVGHIDFDPPYLR